MLVVPGFGCCAELRTAGVGAQQLRGAPFTHVVTDRVRFRVVEDRGDWRRDGARRLTVTDTPIRLGDVDPVVFSEVMRDVDLLVSVAATTLDVDPEDLLLVPEIGEWRRQAGLAAVPLPPREPHFGGVARTRRELLRAILPELVPAGAVELGERHLLVHGRRHRYEIHLGSGDVLVLPFRRQLVLSRPPPPETPEPPRLVLPLHDDVRLHAIVDTILMLVRDDRLRDKTVLAQLDALRRPGALSLTQKEPPPLKPNRETPESGPRKSRRSREPSGSNAPACRARPASATARRIPSIAQARCSLAPSPVE